MGTYEDVIFTFKPSESALSAVADSCRRLRDETPIDELPDGDWERDYDRYRERDFDRDRLAVAVDEEFGQVYFAGRTHVPACQHAWREWVIEGGIGDGILAIVLSHEVDYEGFGWVYEWNPDAEEYKPIVDDSTGFGYGHIDGEPGGLGAIAAHRIRDVADVRPARYWDHIVRWGESGRHEGGFIPDTYFRGREDPPDPRSE